MSYGKAGRGGGGESTAWSPIITDTTNTTVSVYLSRRGIAMSLSKLSTSRELRSGGA